jgi:serine/threonine protein kinase
MYGRNLGSNMSIYQTQKLGEGSYGSVYECRDEMGRKYAVKCIKMTEMGIPNLLETSIMNTISHPCLNAAVHIHSTSEHLYIFQDLALTDLACQTRKSKDRPRVPPRLLRSWCYSLAQAVACLHREKIIHADIKGNNVLLFPDNVVRLGDFTLSVKAWSAEQEIFNHRVCTYSHRPPECWWNQGWSFPLDIWSLACTFFEIAYGRLLFPAQGKMKSKKDKVLVYKKAMNCLLYWARNGPNAMSCPEWIKDCQMHDVEYRKATLPSSFYNPTYAEFNKLLLSMLRIDPHTRPSIDRVLADPYFKGLTPLPYTIHHAQGKDLPSGEEKRVERYIERYTDQAQVKKVALYLYKRAGEVKGVSEHIKAATCVWMAQKLVHHRPKDGGFPRSILHQTERKICKELQFRLHDV